MKKRFYTEAEVNANLNKVKGACEIPPLTRYILIELGQLGLLDAYCQVLFEAPYDGESDPVRYHEYAFAEAYRRVSA